MRYEILETGSEGNATVIEDEILIDCGTAFKRIEPHLQNLCIILLTHSHSDHFRKSTVARMAKARPALRWACGNWMVPALLEAGVKERSIDVLEMGTWYAYLTRGGLVKVSPFATRHDVPNCGWRLFRRHDDTLFYATDLADLDGIAAKDYTTYLLEANHREADLQRRIDEKMDAGEFAYETRAMENHLSVEQAMEWLQRNMGPRSTWVPMHEHKEREKQDGMVRSTPDPRQTPENAEARTVDEA